MTSAVLLQALVALCTVLVVLIHQQWTCAGLPVSTLRLLGLAAKRTISDDQQVAGQPPHLPAKIFAAGVAPQTKYGPAQTKTCPCGGDWRLPSSATPWKQWGRQPSYKRDPDISVDNECIGHSPRIH